MGRGLDLVGLRKDGTEFPVEISLSFIVTEEGTQALARESPHGRTPINLNDVVTETLSLFGQEMARAELSVSCVLDPALSPILGHANALEQVVLNLLTNAVQATAGAGEIRVVTEFAGGRVHLGVVDNGSRHPTGGPAANLRAVLHDQALGDRSGPVGSYGIVHDHTGTIDVRSAPGHRTTFRLSFPPAPDRVVTP